MTTPMPHSAIGNTGQKKPRSLVIIHTDTRKALNSTYTSRCAWKSRCFFNLVTARARSSWSDTGGFMVVMADTSPRVLPNSRIQSTALARAAAGTEVPGGHGPAALIPKGALRCARSAGRDGPHERGTP